MRRLLLLAVLLSGCDGDLDVVSDLCTPGDMKCENNVSYMCDADQFWIIEFDCNKEGGTCIYNRPDLQGGHIELATCEK